MRILVVEDDDKAAAFLKQGLEEEGYDVDVAPDGEAGAHLGHVNVYDLIVLDIQLPRRSGLELSRELRREGVETPIVMLTGRDSTEDIVRGLDAGADDYLTKPFAFDELLARVRALTRRRTTGVAGTLRYADVELDRLRAVVSRAGRPVELSPREFRLLEYFLLHPEEIVTRVALLQKVWNMSFDPETNVVEAHLSNLRRKLEEGDRPRLIQTVRGAGYVLRGPEPGA
ncbi:MAG TPA: response regulator transcription factor [Gemmatimonadales bacterium]|jgi:DNA-binding response OmpR family regulator|nr:response regulator transcription factor [Gemmatimonadales bacterium]